MSKINFCCPYCGSTDITADVIVKVTGELMGDGKIIANDYWTPDTFTNEVFPAVPEEDITGFCKKCGKTCKYSWEEGFILDREIAKDTKVYLVEYGEILLSDNDEFDSYNIVYDKQFGYYDYEQQYTFDFMKTIKSLKEYHKINDKADNYYIIATDQGKLDNFDKNFKIDDGPENCDYDMDSVVYYEGRVNGEPIKMKNTNIKNALLYEK